MSADLTTTRTTGLPDGHRDAVPATPRTTSGAPVEPPPPGPPVGLGALGWARWAWRQLTSMRTALFLLLLLAVAAVPGSIVPQRGIDAGAVAQYAADHPDLAPWLDRLGFFEVYASPWFSAIYLLLFTSLVGCVLPRARAHARGLRAAPPRTPARLDRLPVHRRDAVDADPDAVLAAARAVLRRRRYRVADSPTSPTSSPTSVAAQRGELRETGNLVFHLALVGLLVAVAVGSLVGYRGQALVPVGTAFAHSLAEYDSFDGGSAFDPADLPPFRFVLDDLAVRFEEEAGGNQFGAPRDFDASVTVTEAPGQAPERRSLRVNEPLRVDGASVYLAGHGYAPVLRVTDGQGQVAWRGQVPFLPQDANLTSVGVLKVPDALPEQLGIQGRFLPTGQILPDVGPVSVFPDLRDPLLVITAYAGDLGLDDGLAQNAYTLDTSGMEQLRSGDDVFRASLRPGDSVELPDGMGTVTFERVDRYAGVTVRHDPARVAALAFAVLAMAGLTASLFVPRRRLWVRAVPLAGGGSEVEVGALARSEDPGLAREADAVWAAVRAALPVREARAAGAAAQEEDGQ